MMTPQSEAILAKKFQALNRKPPTPWALWALIAGCATGFVTLGCALIY